MKLKYLPYMRCHCYDVQYGYISAYTCHVYGISFYANQSQQQQHAQRHAVTMTTAATASCSAAKRTAIIDFGREYYSYIAVR